jgi:hypothetical protein
VLDDYTSGSQGVVQYLTNVSIVFTRHPGGDKRILPPLFQIEYSQIMTADIRADPSIVRLTKETLTHHRFNFEVRYMEDMAYFWSAVQIIFSVVISLAIVYAIFRVAMYVRVEGQAGLHPSIMLGAAGLGLDIVGSSLFAVVFFLGFYIFAGFKSGSDLLLPPEEVL